MTQRIKTEDDVTRVEKLAVYVNGMAEGRDDDMLREAAEWLDKLSDHMCGQGYIGCHGKDCNSDHK